MAYEICKLLNRRDSRDLKNKRNEHDSHLPEAAFYNGHQNSDHSC